MSAPTQTQAEIDRDEALHYRAMARRLTDMAMDLAEDAYLNAKSSADRHSTAPEPNSPKLDLKADFERASRTARLCMLLARKLAEPLPAPRSPSQPAANPPLDRTAARKRVIREVEDAIDLRRRTHKIDPEPLEAELRERLDRPDFEIDLATRPIELIIADLARDVGCGHPLGEIFRVWKRRTPEDIDILAANAAKSPPTGPRPPGTATRAPAPVEIQLPDDPAEAVAMVLRLGKIRDG